MKQLRPANENETAPIAGRVIPLADMARSAQLESAVKLIADHGRIVCQQAARGDAQRFSRMLSDQGQVFLLAGLQLIAEAGE